MRVKIESGGWYLLRRRDRGVRKGNGRIKLSSGAGDGRGVISGDAGDSSGEGEAGAQAKSCASSKRDFGDTC